MSPRRPERSFYGADASGEERIREGRIREERAWGEGRQTPPLIRPYLSSAIRVRPAVRPGRRGASASALGRGADQRPLLHALQNGGEAEETEHQIEIPVLDDIAARAFAVAPYVRLIARQSQGRALDARQTPNRVAVGQLPGHDLVGQIGQGVAQGRQFPVPARR